jgi:protein tyrosine/serine phosphatase
MRPSSRYRVPLLVALALWAPMVADSRAQSHAGLPRFGGVSDHLYRGGQPEGAGFAELKKLGIDIVVNLRHETEEIARERKLVEAQGMRFVSIPWRGKQDPKPEQVSEFLGLLRDNPDRKVFVHCQRGAERTGVMVACYRMSRDQWKPEQALAEMEKFGFRGLRFGHLKRFVREFPTLLLNNPFLKTLAPAAAVP